MRRFDQKPVKRRTPSAHTRKNVARYGPPLPERIQNQDLSSQTYQTNGQANHQAWRSLAWDWIKDHQSKLIISIGAIGMAYAAVGLGFMDNKEAKNGAWLLSCWGVLLIVSSFATLIGTILSWKNEPTIKQLEQEKSHLETTLYLTRNDYRHTMNSNLRLLAGELGFRDTERISVYRNKERRFIMLGRYSLNPVFNNPGRSEYSANEGCIGRAWRDGTFYYQFCDPDTQEDQYYGEHETFGIKKSIVKKFKMKIRCIFGYAIQEPKDSERIAVIVFESTNPDNLDREAIEAKMMASEAERIAHVLDKLQAWEPDPSDATQEGF